MGFDMVEWGDGLPEEHCLPHGSWKGRQNNTEKSQKINIINALEVEYEGCVIQCK